MKITKAQLKAGAEKEALLLHATTTKDERNDLIIENFEPMKSTGCIYGLLTGLCYSQRAKRLQKKCASEPFFADAKYGAREAENLISGYTQLEHYIYNVPRKEAIRILNLVKNGK